MEKEWKVDSFRKIWDSEADDYEQLLFSEMRRSVVW
jgi:hypothetical protein